MAIRINYHFFLFLSFFSSVEFLKISFIQLQSTVAWLCWIYNFDSMNPLIMTGKKWARKMSKTIAIMKEYTVRMQNHPQFIFFLSANCSLDLIEISIFFFCFFFRVTMKIQMDKTRNKKERKWWQTLSYSRCHQMAFPFHNPTQMMTFRKIEHTFFK